MKLCACLGLLLPVLLTLHCSVSDRAIPPALVTAGARTTVCRIGENLEGLDSLQAVRYSVYVRLKIVGRHLWHKGHSKKHRTHHDVCKWNKATQEKAYSQTMPHYAHLLFVIVSLPFSIAWTTPIHWKSWHVHAPTPPRFPAGMAPCTQAPPASPQTMTRNPNESDPKPTYTPIEDGSPIGVAVVLVGLAAIRLLVDNGQLDQDFVDQYAFMGIAVAATSAAGIARLLRNYSPKKR